MKSERRILISLLCTLTAAAVLASCSGKVDDPEKAEMKILAAYGGPDKISLLQNYTGKGFMKDITSKSIARSHPLDIYQKGEKFKIAITRLKMGKPVELMMTIYDGADLYQWTYDKGRASVPRMELIIKKYKFPSVLEWIQRNEARAALRTDAAEKNTYTLHYEVDDDIVDLKVDAESWLLKESLITSKTDSSFIYSEAYGDYREVDGIWFPNRFTGTFRNVPYYEYLIPVITYGTDIPDSIFSVTTKDTAFISRVLSESREQGGE